MSKFVPDPEVEKLNQELKAANIPLTVVRLSKRLYLRGTLPPKPGTGDTQPSRQRIPLGVYANPAGYKAAKAEAFAVAEALIWKRFDWDKYLKQEPSRQSVKGWVKAFEAQYFTERARTPKSETTWDKDYRLPFSKLPSDEPLTTELLLEAIALTKPDTRERLRRCTAYGALAKFAGIALDVSKLRGKYSSKAVQPRDLPNDELIAEWRDRIPNGAWRWFYGMMAAYGLRPHEVFLIDPDSVRRSPVAEVVESDVTGDAKTGYRKVYPLHKEWWQQWELFNVQIPDVTAKANRDYGLRAGQYFKRLELPFTLYNLRHAWAARSARLGFSVAWAARVMGHSQQVHEQTYQRFINDRDLEAVWAALPSSLPEDV